MYLKKENCSSYMLGSRARLGYFPKGGTMRLKTRAMHTNTAGSTIWNDVFFKDIIRNCKQTTQENLNIKYYMNNIPEQRNLSGNVGHTGSVSRAKPQTAVSSDSSPSPGTNLYHQRHPTSPSHVILQVHQKKKRLQFIVFHMTCNKEYDCIFIYMHQYNNI